MSTSATATLPTDFKADKNDTTVRSVGTYAAAGTATERVGGASLASNASAGIYNFGSGTTTTGSDRGVGFLSTGSATKSGNLYIQLANNSGANYSGLRISYDVEKYRNGSNAAGYSLQMYYSTDGSSWTSAGSNFLTSFAADADNSGFTTAPGTTSSVTNKLLSQTINNGSNFYLAWNYSVTSGTTTTNAQALAIDNITINGTQTISGTLFDSNGSPITGGRTIKLIQNGAVSATTATTDNVTGIYTFSGLTLTSGDRIATFIDGATEKGVTATLIGTPEDITNFDIKASQLTVRTDNGGSTAITNSNLAESDSSKDSDIPFAVSSGTLTTTTGTSLRIDSSSTYTPGGNINDAGNWENNGTFTPGTFTVTMNGTANQTIGGLATPLPFYNLTIDNAGTSPNNLVTLYNNITAANVLTVNRGVFDQNVTGNSANIVTTGSATNVVAVNSLGAWQNFGTGAVTLSGGVSNNGTIIFNANGTPCGDVPGNDSILIRSSDSGNATPTQRVWSGTGTFSMTDVNVKDQKVPGLPNPPLAILVNSGTDAGNNPGWTFVDQCTSGTYTWIGGTVGANTDWTVGTNWNPTRAPANGDILIFNGDSTPSPIVTNVPAQTIAALRLTNNVNGVTLNAGADGNQLTISGFTGTDFSVPNGSVLTLNGSNALKILVSGANQGSVGGQILLQGGGHRILGGSGSPNPAAITFGSGSKFTTTTGFTGNPFGTGTDGSVILGGGSSSFFGAGGDPFGGDGHSVVTFGLVPMSNQEFSAASALSTNGRAYGNLTLTGNQTFAGAGSGQTTVSGNFTLGNSVTLTDGSTFKLSDDVGGNLNLLGNFSDVSTNANAFNANLRTVLFQGGNTTQTISKQSGTESFFDVFIAETAGGEVKLLSPLTINGQLNLSTADSLLELNTKTLTLNGTVTGSGNFKGDASATLNVGGTSGSLGTLNFLSGSRTLSQMTMNRTSLGEMTFGNDMTIGSSVTLTSGLVKLGANTLSLNSAATASSNANSYVTGNVRKTFGAAGTLIFPIGTDNGYSPVDANVAVGGTFPADFTASANQTKEPHIHGATVNALKRYWTLTASGITADLTFHYLDPADIPTDINAGYTDANYVIWKYNGALSMPGGSVNTSANTATITGVTSFSNWTLADAAAVMPGTLSFAGAPYSDSETSADHTKTITVSRTGGSDGAVSVHWATSAGTATAGTDYVEASGDVSWADNDTADKTFLVTVKGDLTYEANETVNITLSNPTGGATIAGTNPTTLTITNDDAPAANAAFIVNTTDDVDNGACVAAHCSLREAIKAANSLPDANTITFSIPGGDPGCPSGVCTINLTGVLDDLSTDMTITGTGANVLRIRRNTGGDYRIFAIGSGKTVDISGVTITNGRQVGGAGVGVVNSGILKLTDCAVTDNHATGGGSNFGGGIYNAATLTITRCEISGNSATGGSPGNNNGGGVLNTGGLTIVNSTISGNSASGGGGIFNQNQANIYNSTIVNNAGGIMNFGTTNLKSTILANNTFGDVQGNSIISNGFNLIKTGSFTPQSTDIVGIDPNLGPLQDNGGPTQTHALQANGPAIDKGFATPGVTTDQRGQPRTDDPNRPNAVGGDGTDIGAYEDQASCAAATFTPSTLPDGTTNVAYSQTFTPSGGTGPYTFAVTAGSLPNGLSLSGAGVLSGTPTGTGASNFTVTVTDANGCGISRAYTLTINCPTITVNPSSLPNGVTGVAYNHPITASGGTSPHTFAVSGTVPAGLTLNSDGTWSGTPSAANTFNFTVTATDNIGCTGSRAYTVIITSCPSTFTVNNTGDGGDAVPGDGVCDDGAAHCTLRAAIGESNALGSCAAVTIDFSVTGTITLGSQLSVTRSVNINGPGADQLSVSGNDTVPVLGISSSTVAISGLSFTQGRLSAGGLGAGISVGSGVTLNLTECAVSNNKITGGSIAGGAGIYNNSGIVNITRSEIYKNSISGVSGNQVGGGIYNAGAMTIVNSTISTNSCLGGPGGGIFTEGSSHSLAIANSTIAENSAGDGGGIRVYGFAVDLRNTIVANNTAVGSGPDLSALLGGSFNSQGHNLVRDPSGYTPDATDINNQDPKLDPLSNYGGPTQTYRLQATSPAIDTGDNCVFDLSCSPGNPPSALTTDQRGAGFSRKLDGDNNGTATVDIGAFELPFVNTAPVIEDPGTLNVNTNSTTQFDVFANDADSAQSLSFSVATGTGGCPDPANGKFNSISFSAPQQVSTSPNRWKSVLTINSMPNSEGDYTKRIRVFDGTDETFFCLNIHVSFANTPTVWVTTSGAVDEPMGADANPVLRTVPVTVNEVDNSQTLTFSVVGTGQCGASPMAPFSFVDFTPNPVTSGAGNEATSLRINVGANDAGTWCFRVKVNDGFNDSTQDLSITVNAQNSNLAIEDPGTLNMDTSETRQFDIFANDADALQSLSFSVQPGDGGCPDPPSGKFSSFSFSSPQQVSTSPNRWKSVLTIVSEPSSQGNYTKKIQVSDGTTPTTNCLSISVAPPPPTLTVNKVTVPSSDTGLFNLQIDGSTSGTGENQGDGGTTGAVTVSAGNHTVGETAGTGTNLSNYTSAITGDCASDGTITLAAGDNKVCTITNTRNTPPTSLVVTKTDDSDDHDCSLTDCSLREALEAANFDPDTNTITFSIDLSNPANDCNGGFGPCTITLGSGDGVGQLAATQSVNINGPTAYGVVVSGSGDDRVLNVQAGDVSISNLTISDGDVPFGGGIGTSAGANLTVTNCTITGNHASQGGGGINNDGALTLINSTVSGNSADKGGGGIRNPGALTLMNSTISGNWATKQGGGILNDGGTANITNSTITDNSGFNAIRAQGNDTGDGTVNIRNTIVAANWNDDVFDVVGSFNSLGHNLIGQSDGTNGFDSGANDQVGSDTSPIDPGLGFLQNNGGPTETHALLIGSPAIDTGDDCVIDLSCSSNNPSSAITTDQRGVARPQGPHIDIGAFEFQTFVVNTTADTDDGCTSDPGGCSLREAINAANQSGGGRITFAIPFDDGHHYYYADDGQNGVSLDHVTLVPNTATTDAEISGKDPQWQHSWWSIRIQSGLPEIEGNVLIDGYSQPGARANPNTLANGDDGILRIEIDGTNDSNGIGLDVCGFGGSTIQGLVINRFTSQQVWIISDVNTIQGNFIGTDISGTLAFTFPEDCPDGIRLDDASYNDIGGGDPAQRNIISGNCDNGILLYSSLDSVFQRADRGNGNKLGPWGKPNRAVKPDSAVRTNPATTSRPGSARAPQTSEQSFFFSSSNNNIEGNYIGTDRTGTQALGNEIGIQNLGGSDNMIGCTVPEEGNIISGNNDDGILIKDTNACYNTIQGNFIGTAANGVTALGNDGAGVAIYDAVKSVIGRTMNDNGLANTIAFNTGAGVEIETGSFNPGTRNIIRRNSIYSNDGLGIDLVPELNNTQAVRTESISNLGNAGSDGVTLNDDKDPDTGANNLQNFPTITSATAGSDQAARNRLDGAARRSDSISLGGGVASISGTLNSTPGQTFKIDFYKNAECNAAPPNNYGEGQTWIGSIVTDPATDSDGNVSFVFNPSSLNALDIITATATDANGNTSEFSKCFEVPSSVQSTTTVITNASSLSTTPSTFNVPFTVQWSVTPSGGTGTVTVSVASSTESCTAPVADNQCQITPTSAGTKQLTATYSGDTNFTGSSSSPAVSHVVDKASTSTAITNASSLSGTPSNIGQAFTVQWQVTSTPAGATGTVSVTVDGNPGCSALVSAGQCDITPSTSGTKSLVAHYGGDGNFLSSDSSPAVNHTVSAPLISGHVDYCISPSVNVPGVTINVTGSQTTSTTTDSSGNYSINLVEGGNYTLTPTKTALAPTASGIDTADVVGAQRHYLGMTSLNGCALTAADADKDATVDTVDAIAIQQFFLGSNSSTGHVGEWQFNPANRPYSNLAVSQSAQDYDALVIGDITGDLPPSLANPEGGNSAAAGSITPSSVTTVSLPVGNVGTNVTVFTLPVTTSNINASDNLVGFQGDFTFDSSVVTFQANPASPAGLTATNWNVSGSILGAGTIKTLRISAFSTTSTPLSGSGTLFNLNFTRVSNTIGAFTDLTWASSPNNFVFIDTNLVKQAPGSTPAGKITIVGPTATNGEVSGQIIDGNGNPVEGAAVRMSGTQNRLTVTDANGRYNFAEVETNGFYTVTPSRSNFGFSPSQRSFSALGQHTDAAFNASATGTALNPLDATEYFVRQQYVDFLGREPDEAGLNFWVNNIESCGADQSCRAVKHIDTSAAFFLSIEFQQTGYLVYRTYQAAYGDLPSAPVPIRLGEFKPDTAEIGNGVVVNKTGWEALLENNKLAFFAKFVQRQKFAAAYPTAMTPTEFVGRLFLNAGVTPSANDQTAAINEFGSSSTSADAAARGRALRRVAENSALARQEFNQAFVLMQYFGYLRRDANTAPDADFTGYDFWLNKLNAFQGNFADAEMVKAFLVSGEYRGRFPR